MSTLKRFHDFVEILGRYLQIPFPKMPLGNFIQKEIQTLEDQDAPMTFSINARDGIIFFGHVEIRNKGMFSGLISSLELKADGISLTIHHSPTDFTDLGEIPFSDIIAFHQIRPRGVKDFLPAEEPEPVKRSKTVKHQPEGENRANRHTTKPVESQPGIQL